MDLSRTEALVGTIPSWQANLADVMKRFSPPI